MCKTIITYGTFDMFHVGHLKLIKRLSSLGDRLVIGVSTDEFNELKGKQCIIPYEHRKSIVENIKGVDLVIPEKNWEQKKQDIIDNDVSLFIMGDDWKGKFDFLSEYCEVRYLPRTEGISSTQLRNILSKPIDKFKNDIDEVFKLMETIKQNLN